MHVSELIERLKDAAGASDPEVAIVFDGAARASVDRVWKAKSGRVLLAEKEEPIYYEADQEA